MNKLTPTIIALLILGALTGVAAELGAQIVQPSDIKRLESGAPPILVAAAPTGPTSLQVIWQAAPGASGYHVFRGRSANGPWVQVTSQPVTGSFFNDTGLAPFLQVYYRVDAHYPDKAPGVSAPVTGKTPSAHPSLFAKELVPGAVQLGWSPMPGAKEYWITGSGMPNGVMVQGTSHTLQSLSPGSYQYTLITYFDVAPFGTIEGGDLAQAPTAWVNVTPKPPPPAKLLVEQPASDRLRVTWEAVPNARLYQVQVIDPASPGLIAQPEKPLLEYKGVKPLTKVHFTVRALYPLYDVTKESTIPPSERKFEQGNVANVSYITSDGSTKTCAVTSAAPGVRQTLAVLDTMLKNNPTKDSFVVALFMPPPDGNKAALRMVIERGGPFGIAQNEVDIGLAIQTKRGKEIAGWDFCDQKPVGAIRQTSSTAPPVRGRLNKHQAFTIVFRTETAIGTWSNKYHFDPTEFWNILGGHRVTFTWIQD
jgi:hypothetical protein